MIGGDELGTCNDQKRSAAGSLAAGDGSRARGLRRRDRAPRGPGRLAERAADAGDYRTAEVLYRRAFDADPRSVDALAGLGRSYAGLGQYARGEQALLEANRRRPRDPEILLARAQLGAGRAPTALVTLDRARALAPRDLAILTARGIALDRLSRHAEAKATCRAGLATRRISRS